LTYPSMHWVWKCPVYFWIHWVITCW